MTMDITPPLASLLGRTRHCFSEPLPNLLRRVLSYLCNSLALSHTVCCSRHAPNMEYPHRPANVHVAPAMIRLTATVLLVRQLLYFNLQAGDTPCNWGAAVMKKSPGALLRWPSNSQRHIISSRGAHVASMHRFTCTGK